MSCKSYQNYETCMILTMVAIFVIIAAIISVIFYESTETRAVVSAIDVCTIQLDEKLENVGMYTVDDITEQELRNMLETTEHGN